jgi:hypothetical protein
MEYIYMQKIGLSNGQLFLSSIYVINEYERIFKMYVIAIISNGRRRDDTVVFDALNDIVVFDALNDTMVFDALIDTMVSMP